VPVQVLSGDTQLYNEIAREILRLDLAALLPPQPEEGGFVIAHDDPGIRPPNKVTASFAGVMTVP